MKAQRVEYKSAYGIPLSHNPYNELREIEIQKTKKQKKKLASMGKCPICMEDKLLYSLLCNHQFCLDCQQRWTKNCAICRKVFNVETKHQEMIQIVEEIDPLTQQYLEQNTLACPRCGIRCVHIGGCSYVTCTLCKNSFLWNGPREGSISNDICLFLLEFAKVVCVLSIPFLGIYSSIMLISKNRS